MKLALAVLLASAAVRAVPPDARLEISGRAPRIEKIEPGFTAVESDAPLIVRAELLPSGNELLLEPAGAGVAHVFLFAPRLVRALEVGVDARLASAAPPPRGCPAVRDAGCYEQWREALRQGPVAAPLVFEVEGLQAEARAAQAELATAGLRHVQLAVGPFGVRLKGARDDAEKRRALRTIWPAMLGPLRVEP